MQTICQKEALQILTKNLGQFLTVTFIKKSGEIRQLNGKIVKSPASHAQHYDLFCIEAHEKGQKIVRTLDTTRILRLAGQGKILESEEYRVLSISSKKGAKL